MSKKTFFILILLLLTPWTRAQGKKGIYLEGIDELSAVHSVHFQGDGHLHLVNPKGGEELVVNYRDAEGRYDVEKIEAIRRLLRCRLTGQVAEIPIELIELVDKIQDHFHSSEVMVLSGYRSPRFNAALRRVGRHAARHSLHMKGLAMDIQLPGIPTRKVRDYARSLQSGGVGYYPQRHFVHVDVGPVRYW